MGIGHCVSRFGIRPRAVRLVERVHARGAVGSSDTDDDRSLAPFFPLSHLLFPFSDAAPVLKKARSSAFPPRSPGNNDHRPAFALFPPTLPSPLLSFSPTLIASGHSTPYTWRFVHTQVQPAFLSASPLSYVFKSSFLGRFVYERCPRWRSPTRRSHGSGFCFSYEPLAGFESESPIFVTLRLFKCISSSSTSRRYRPFSFRTSS